MNWLECYYNNYNLPPKSWDKPIYVNPEKVVAIESSERPGVSVVFVNLSDHVGKLFCAGEPSNLLSGRVPAAATNSPATHSRGPWHVSHHDRQMVCSGSQESPVDVVARVPYIGKETDANALLIAAAPDLLIACRAALNDRMFKDWPGIATLLVDAIAKAEGS